MKNIFVLALIFVIALIDIYLFVQVGLADDEIIILPQKELFVQKQSDEYSLLQTFSTAGIVKKIDPENGIVTLSLAPVPDLKWPLMIRTLSVTDKSAFERIKVGEELKFEFESDEMIVDLR